MTVFDMDDYTGEQWQQDLLTALRYKVPGLKVTLFAVLGVCDAGELAELAQQPGVEVAAHGWQHKTSKECAQWGLRESEAYVQKLCHFPYIKGFKAPGWQGTPVLYKTLAAAGYWIADMSQYEKRHSADGQVYRFDCVCGACKACEHYRVHGHLPDVCGNGLAQCWDFYTSLPGPFATISEVMA